MHDPVRSFRNAVDLDIVDQVFNALDQRLRKENVGLALDNRYLAGEPPKAETRMRPHIQKTAERSLPRYRSTGSD